ncbi:hypothetical protein ACKLNR_013947 [Fusarium oxysporum f. sp. zingiberi]
MLCAESRHLRTTESVRREIFGLSISHPLPWFTSTLSQYNKWVEQLPEVHRLEKYREETRSELEGLHADQFRHEKVQVALEPEYLGYHVREYRDAYLTSGTKLREVEHKRKVLQERLSHLEEQIGSFEQELEEYDGSGCRKGGNRCMVELLSLGPHAIAGWGTAWFNALYSAAHGTATANDGDSANGQLEAEGGHMEIDME